MDSDQLEQRLGRAVRAKRIQVGLTQQQLADQANVSLGAVRHLEAGQGAAVRTLLRATSALGVVDWIEQIAVPQASFSPLQAAELAAREAAAASRRPRVRRRPVDAADPSPSARGLR